MINRHELRRSIVKKAYGLIRGEGQSIFTIIVYGIGVGLCSLVVPVAVQSIVSSVVFLSIFQPLILLTAIVAVILLFSGIMRLMQLWAAEILERRFLVRGALSLSEKLCNVETQQFTRSYGPDYVVRFMELFNVQKLLTIILLDGTAVFFQILIGLVLVSFYHPLFLAFSILLLSLISIIIFVFGIGAFSTSIEESETKYDILNWLQVIARRPQVFKSEYSKKFAINKTNLLVLRYLKDRKNHFSILFRQHIGALLLQAFMSALLLGFGGWLVIKGQLSLGQLVAAELIFSLVLASLTKLGRHLEKISDLAASVTKLDSVFDIPIEKPEGNYFGVTETPAELSVIDLTYHSESFTEPLLHNINFKIPAGGKGIIWGPNGSGKSVLADVVYRFDRPSYGRVEIDSHPVSDIHPKELRSEVSLVRGIELFSGTIEENLLLGNKSIDNRSIKEVLRSVGLENDIYSLPDGIKTKVRSDNILFSSGQALRLMVARGILMNPRLLIIDGTLDSMDETSQSIILKLIKDQLNKITVLVLTHEFRLSGVLPLSFKIQGNKLIQG